VTVPIVDKVYGTPRGGRGRGDGEFALVVHQPREAGRRENQGHGRGPSEERGGGVRIGYVTQHARAELDPVEGLPAARVTQLRLGRAVDVVERRAGNASSGEQAQVADAGRPVQPRPAAPRRRLEPHERSQVGPAWQLPSHVLVTHRRQPTRRPR
jgi:hypothetical protein